MLTQNLCNQARKRASGVGLILFVFLLTACGTQPAPPATPTSPPTETPTPQPTLTPTPTVIPGPFESQPAIPYPSEEVVQGLGITDYQVVDNHYVALDDEGDVVAQATTNENGEFTGWQRTVPLPLETNLVVSHPQETNPELLDLKKSDAPIPQFVNAMEMGGITVDPQEVVANLQYQTITGADGKQYVVGSYNLDPNPNQQGETLEGPIPLMIWSEGGWSSAGLKNFYKIGVSTSWDLLNTEKRQFNRERERYKSIFLKDFNTYTAQFSWEGIQPNEPNSYDFSVLDWQFDQLRKLGLSRNLNLVGHSLFNGTVIPNWLRNGNYSRDQVIEFMKKYITTVIKRYKGKIKEMVIVNEPAGIGGWNQWRDDFYYKKIGPDYIDIAFETAREADPELILIFNDTDNHSPNGMTTRNTLQVVQRLKSKGLIDGVGVQMHLDGAKPFNKEAVINTLREYGLPVYVTEFDIDMSNVRGTPEERLRRQAEIVRTVMEAVLESNVVISFTMWEGPGDRFNWLENYLHKDSADGTLWTDQLEPKPSYYAMIQVLFIGVTQFFLMVYT